MARSSEEERGLVTSLLSPDYPTGESELMGLLAQDGLTLDEAKRTLDGLMADGDIRWVAFRGYCRGGRPV